MVGLIQESPCTHVNLIQWFGNTEVSFPLVSGLLPGVATVKAGLGHVLQLASLDLCPLHSKYILKTSSHSQMSLIWPLHLSLLAGAQAKIYNTLCNILKGFPRKKKHYKLRNKIDFFLNENPESLKYNRRQLAAADRCMSTTLHSSELTIVFPHFPFFPLRQTAFENMEKQTHRGWRNWINASLWWACTI